VGSVVGAVGAEVLLAPWCCELSGGAGCRVVCGAGCEAVVHAGAGALVGTEEGDGAGGYGAGFADGGWLMGWSMKARKLPPVSCRCAGLPAGAAAAY
jgi:hypothetical protein